MSSENKETFASATRRIVENCAYAWGIGFIVGVLIGLIGLVVKKAMMP